MKRKTTQEGRYNYKPTETEINSILCQSPGIVSCIYYRKENCPMTCGLAEGQLEKRIENKFESGQPKR